jgi:o-succinylbenzoate synthase
MLVQVSEQYPRPTCDGHSLTPGKYTYSIHLTIERGIPAWPRPDGIHNATIAYSIYAGFMFRLSFHPYHRRFKHPLQTHHGLWLQRDGILLQLEDERGRIGAGEIAPLPWFGSESLEEALYFCQHLPAHFSLDELETIPATLPACQFGFGSALESLQNSAGLSTCENRALLYSALLPTGEAALTAWPALWEQGYRTYKLKIGVSSMAVEQDLCRALLLELPSSAQLRLDANGGLDLQTTQAWLEMCDGLRPDSCIEYLEQPLPAHQVAEMLLLSQQYTTPIALDESVATLNQLIHWHEKGWLGIFVIKPAISGYPQRLRQFCQTHSIDVVCSSVFETEVGRRACLQLAETLSTRAVGFGIEHWFAD